MKTTLFISVASLITVILTLLEKRTKTESIILDSEKRLPITSSYHQEDHLGALLLVQYQHSYSEVQHYPSIFCSKYTRRKILVADLLIIQEPKI